MRHHHQGNAREAPTAADSPGAWAVCAKALREHDEDLIRDWKEEIDTLLVFAGLFSAVLTTFNVEAYALLQQQPEDAVVVILTQISAQLNSFSVNSNFVNSTRPADAATSVQPFRPTAFAVRLNVVWFLGLVCALLAASLGLLVKQWLREYLAGSSNISRESIRIRQYRYESLRRWHVPEIILFLPILLQIALLLFFVGLLDLLWTLHPVVAGVVTALVVVAMTFTSAAACLPPFCANCPYKSPQSWLIFTFIQSTKRVAASLATPYYAHLRHRGADPEPIDSILDLPTIVRSRFSRALQGCLRQLSLHRPFSSWKERERVIVRDAAIALDDAILAGADATFMDDSFLHAVVRPCLDEIEPQAALRCLDQILLQRAPRVIHGFPYWDFALEAGDKGTLALMDLLLDVLHRLNQESEQENVDESRRLALIAMHRIVRAIPGPTAPASDDAPTRALLRRTFEVLAGVIDAGPAHTAASPVVRERAFHLMLKLFPRFHSVGPNCILALCTYTKAMQYDNSPYRFMQACTMVIRTSASLARHVRPEDRPCAIRTNTSVMQDPSPVLEKSKEFQVSRASSYTIYAEPDSADRSVEDRHTDDYRSVRPTVLGVLNDLEDFLSIPVSRAADCRPTIGMLAECAQAAAALAARDRSIVTVAFVSVLEDTISEARAEIVGFDPGDVGEDVEKGGQEYYALLARQALRVLKRMYNLEPEVY